MSGRSLSPWVFVRDCRLKLIECRQGPHPDHGQKPKILPRPSPSRSSICVARTIGAYVTCVATASGVLDRLLTLALPYPRPPHHQRRHSSMAGQLQHGLTRESMFHRTRSILIRSIVAQYGHHCSDLHQGRQGKLTLLKHLLPLQGELIWQKPLLRTRRASRSSRSAARCGLRSSPTPSCRVRPVPHRCLREKSPPVNCPALRSQLVNIDAEGPRPERF